MSSTYPVIRITKNGSLYYELIAFMYVEWLGTSLNNGEQSYCTGFESSLAINGEGIRVDLESGCDDDSITWYQFWKNRVFDFENGEFQNHDSQVTTLFPINDAGRTPLAGVRSLANN